MRLLQKGLVVFAVLITAFMLATVNAMAQSGSSLTVHAVTKRGYPVRGLALVLASDDRVRIAETNGKGQFKFGNLPASKYVLEATYLEFPIATIRDIQLAAQGATDLSITVDPPGGYFVRVGAAHCTLLNIRFVPGTLESIFYDERRDEESVQGTFGPEIAKGPGPVPTIVIFRVGQPEQVIAEVRPDINGTYHFSDLDPGKYQLQISREGFYTGMTVEFWVARGNTTRFGPISMYPDRAQDMCGYMTEIIPFDELSIPEPDPELIPPSANP